MKDKSATLRSNLINVFQLKLNGLEEKQVYESKLKGESIFWVIYDLVRLTLFIEASPFIQSGV